MKHIALFFALTCGVVQHGYGEPVQVENVEPEDQLFADLMRASEEDTEEDDEIADALQLMADAELIKKEHEPVQEPSLLRRYATVAALKAIVWYGACKNYVKQWLVYLWGS
jgi:hypothetical protein